MVLAWARLDDGSAPDDAWRLLRSRARNWIRRRHGRSLCLREGHWLLQWILQRLHMASPLRLKWWMRGLSSSQRQAGRGAMPLREGACANTAFPASLLFNRHTFLKCLRFIVSCTALSLSSSQRNLYFVEFVFVCLIRVFENSFRQWSSTSKVSNVGLASFCGARIVGELLVVVAHMHSDRAEKFGQWAPRSKPWQTDRRR